MTSKIHISNYPPFGVLLQNRNFTSEKYRYGFNGQERDDEVKGSGNSINFEFRMHDPRLGRFLSVDPLFASYPFESPYNYAGNNPIYLIDKGGKTKDTYITIIFSDGTKRTIERHDANYVEKVMAGRCRICSEHLIDETQNTTSSYYYDKYDVKQEIVIRVTYDKSSGTYNYNISAAKTRYKRVNHWWDMGSWNILTGKGETQRGGFHLTSKKGGGTSDSKTKTKATQENPQSLEIDALMELLPEEMVDSKWIDMAKDVKKILQEVFPPAKPESQNKEVSQNGIVPKQGQHIIAHDGRTWMGNVDEKGNIRYFERVYTPGSFNGYTTSDSTYQERSDVPMAVQEKLLKKATE
jgi:RHS repeat-associated protein